MRNKVLFILSFLGVLGGIAAVIVFSREKPAEPPVFKPASNPYSQGIYATGIIESYQTNGENVNIYPEVSGVIKKILVPEGQVVKQGTPLFELDDTVQRATTEQLRSLAEVALGVLDQLRAQPRPETLAINKAQVDAATANLKSVQDQLLKIQRSYRLNPKSISREALDTAINNVKVAQANLEVARKQYQLTRAGAWIYDIQNQERQYEAARDSFKAANALLDKYTIKAPMDGTVLAIRAALGSYVSPQGVYGTYTGGYHPVLVMGSVEKYLELRCYLDEILVHRLPDHGAVQGRMFIRGTNISAPLEFVRIQPYVTPKIELSNQRTERVDVRVLPIVFRFVKASGVNIYPGQLVDVYLEEKRPQQLSGRVGAKTAENKNGQ